MNTRLFTAVVLVMCSGLVACGGGKGPSSPESNAGIVETSSSAEEDMPPPPSESNAEAAAAPAVEGPGAAGGIIKLAAMKLTPAKKGKDDKPVELKEDGTIVIDGKTAAHVKGDQVDSAGGTSMVTVGVDGSLVGNGVKPGYKFDGDELTGENGLRLTVGDDGSITASKDGKSEVIATVENGAASKRAALILTVLYVDVPANPGSAATKGKK